MNCLKPVFILNKNFVDKMQRYKILHFGQDVYDCKSKNIHDYILYLHNSSKITPKRYNISMRNYQDYYIGPRQNNDFIFMPVPCGKCVNCIDNRQSEKVTRALMETYTSGDVPYYVTLTYNPKHLPKDKCLQPSDTVNFLKRLRQKLVRLGYDCKLKYYLCGEYGSKFGRPHYHALIWGIPSQLNYKEVYNLILSAWSTYKLDKDKKRIKNGKTYLFEELGFVYVTRPKLTDSNLDKQVKNLVKYVTKYLQKANVPRTNDNKSVRGRVYDVRQIRTQEPTSSYGTSTDKAQIDEINITRNQDIQFDELNKEWYKYSSRVQSQRTFPVDTMEIRLLGFVPRLIGVVKCTKLERPTMTFRYSNRNVVGASYLTDDMIQYHRNNPCDVTLSCKNPFNITKTYSIPMSKYYTSKLFPSKSDMLPLDVRNSLSSFIDSCSTIIAYLNYPVKPQCDLMECFDIEAFEIIVTNILKQYSAYLPLNYRDKFELRKIDVLLCLSDEQIRTKVSDARLMFTTHLRLLQRYADMHHVPTQLELFHMEDLRTKNRQEKLKQATEYDVSLCLQKAFDTLKIWNKSASCEVF